MFLCLGRFSVPTEQEYVALAQRYQHVVQAVYDYKAEHGAWPQTLDDLVPAYLPAYPKPPLVWYDGYELSIHADVPHTGVCYTFCGAGKEGWAARGDFGTGPLPLAKLASTRPALPSSRPTTAHYFLKNVLPRALYLLIRLLT